MFFTNKRSKHLIAEIGKLERERDSLTDRNRTLKDDLAELEQKRKMEDEDIKHLVKLKESKLDIEFQKKAVELQGEQQKAIAEVKDQYRDKLEKELQNQLKRMQAMYGEILGRLPNVNVRLKGDV